MKAEEMITQATNPTVHISGEALKYMRTKVLKFNRGQMADRLEVTRKQVDLWERSKELTMLESNAVRYVLLQEVDDSFFDKVSLELH